MAEAIANQELFTCSICLDLLKDPVTIFCGHTYCMDCIKGCWNQEDCKRIYSCPQCRQTFSPRPPLCKNNLFAELVEQIKKTKIQDAAVHSYAGPDDVECDLCPGRKLKALSSCLDCLLSYCEAHYKVHNDVNPGRKHNVIDATSQLGLQERICSKHEKPLEVFCRTDESCVCLFCLVDEHKGHDTVSASAEKKEKRFKTKITFQQRIQERENMILELRKAVETLKSTAQTAVKDSERIFTEMIRAIERRRSEVTELIRAQEKAEVSRAEGLLKRLEQEIAELKRRDAELEGLFHTEDHIHFLKAFLSIRDLPEFNDLSGISINPSIDFEAVRKLLSALKGQLENGCKQEVSKISSEVTKVQSILTSVPTTREEFLQYSCHFTLDPNTAHTSLHLSEGNRRVERRAGLQSYPDHPERFDGWPQVLCREGVSGRCYWEVERNDTVAIAISYKCISRKGDDDDCRFGYNGPSWSLRLFESDSYFIHNTNETKLPLVASSRIGVYVDHRAGTLAFYSISDAMTLLHRVQTTFTDTLYPGFSIVYGSSLTCL